MNANELAQSLVEHGIISQTEIEGCSEEDISKLENFCNLSLPKTYREFLTVMGKRSGRYFAGTHMRYESLFELRNWAINLLIEDESDFELPNNAFVYYMHQGAAFNYFLVTNDSEDPPVYGFEEGDRQPTLLYSKFSESFEDSLKFYINYYSKPGSNDAI